MQFSRVLLVNPPIYDFTAYDFWLHPYGMLRVAGRMRHACQLSFFDFLVTQKKDPWGRGHFERQDLPRPHIFNDIPRRFHRFGLPRSVFRDFLQAHTFDFVLIQSVMTYWYLGIREVIEDIREFQPDAKIIVGGVYATLCPAHARSLGPDLVIEGADLEPLWRLLSLEPRDELPYWPPNPAGVGVMKLSEGCPFRCTYCSAQLFWPEYVQHSIEACLEEFKQLTRAGVRNIAFYDDALLYRADRVLIPFLHGISDLKLPISFHTPNAMNARFIDMELAQLMVRSGFASFFLGLESSDMAWQQSTGGKVGSDEFAAAVGYLKESGAGSITAYIIIGHPDSEGQAVESTIDFANRCGARVLLSEFSPVPGTVDGVKCSPWADLSEPLSHNKTAFAIRRLGLDKVNQLKQFAHLKNAALTSKPQGFEVNPARLKW